jgi:hypothetical protein
MVEHRPRTQTGNRNDKLVLAAKRRMSTMIAVTLEKRYGTATARVRVRAASIERALRLAGEGARVVFPIDTQLYFAAEDIPEGIEEIPPVGNEEVAA